MKVVWMSINTLLCAAALGIYFSYSYVVFLNPDNGLILYLLLLFLLLDGIFESFSCGVNIE